MSTNYEWTISGVPQRHIGKTTRSEGHGQFIWAADPVQTVYALCFLYAGREVVRDEYGETYTPHAMLEVIVGCDRQRYELVGQEFS